ncbi:MAG TPA: bifunctional phosphoglucose/phosphomannose isomerase [Acidimicrobiales bacterium]|nr:bifunctional phosphoglucose/phosphomannose isomerase [Acidimicrobiales bacterium]
MTEVSTETSLDSLGMLAAAAALPEQVGAVLGESWGFGNLPDHDEVEHVVVIGMGGSGIAGEVLASAAGPYMPVPVMVFKSYNVPAFIGEGSLVFAVSFSGDTEETVEAATEAALQGAKIVAITTGGQLGDLAEAWGAPVVRVPESIPQPRAAIGALAVPPMLVLEEIGLFPGAHHWVEAAVEQLGKRRDELVRPGNQAEVLARGIGRTIPLIHGGGGLGAVAAHRWKTQMNENAKAPAFWNAQPEVCHNEIAGWGQHGDLTRQAFTLVNLRHDFEHPQVMHRFGITRDVLDEVVADICDVQADGDGELAQLLDLVMVGDFVSTHLALQQGVDPGPVPAIDEIKTALATSAGQDSSAEGALSS